MPLADICAIQFGTVKCGQPRPISVDKCYMSVAICPIVSKTEVSKLSLRRQRFWRTSLACSWAAEAQQHLALREPPGLTSSY
jgi:hypothetical protein